MSKINNKDFDKRLYELGKEKDIRDYTWQDISDLLQVEFCSESFCRYITSDYCRRRFNYYLNNNEDKEYNDVENILHTIKKERAKLSDEIVQNNAYVRKLAREETLKEIAKEYAEIMYKGKILDTFIFSQPPDCENEAILQLSDWHYGLEVDNYCNKFNPEICIKRVNTLRDEVIRKCRENKVFKIHVVNLSDLISGYIHLQLRLQNRYDVITQIMDVSEILAELLNDLSKFFDIEYYDCLDNHSRLDPNKKDSFNLESLVRITHWYLVERFKNNDRININDYSVFGEDIVSFTSKGWDIAGVHGDNDTINNIVERLSLVTDSHFDLILMAHKHHFASYEDGECIVLQNGSLMGTDYYATKLRKRSTPSQNLIIISNRSVVDSIHRINLNEEYVI